MYIKKSKLKIMKDELEYFSVINILFSTSLKKYIDNYYLERGRE